MTARSERVKKLEARINPEEEITLKKIISYGMRCRTEAPDLELEKRIAQSPLGKLIAAAVKGRARAV